MKTTRHFAVPFILLLFMFTSLLGQQENEQITRYLEQARTVRGTPGISCAVALLGNIIYSGGVGYADLDNMAPATAATVHNVGSVSKVNAVVAVMQLVEQGKVKLDQPIQTYVPSFPRKRWPVTVRHIMTHTSGIRHYKADEFGGKEAFLENNDPFTSFEEALTVFKDDTLLFQPGSYWSYSSFAINLFQGIIENVTGLGFEDYLRKYVWEPAGMLSTAFDVPSRIVKHRARGYRRNEAGTLINEPYGDMSYKYAGGGVISTAEDLVRLCMALNHGVLLNPKTVEQMYATDSDSVLVFSREGEHKKSAMGQGLIWRVSRDVQGRPFIQHSGAVRGFRTYLLNYVEHDLVVAVIGNYQRVNSGRYAKAIAQLFLPESHKKRN